MTSGAFQRVRCWARRDDGARWAFRAALGASLVEFYVTGDRQWFIRDDWALLLTRHRLLHHRGAAAWLLSPQDGHWLTIPTLVYRGLESALGLGSYWPFLLTAIVTHVAIVLLVRVLCRRLGVSAWTTTLVCSVLLVFGSGWENILFAVQISYNLSLLGFLAQLLLTDHAGPVDWRDGAGLACGLVGLMSSGFGPFFIFGIGVLLAIRRRWAAATIATIPLAIGYVWWWVVWGADDAGSKLPGDKRQVPEFAMNAVTATYGGLVAISGLAGVALLGSVAVIVSRSVGPMRPVLVALALTAAAMFVGIGWQRVGFGTLESASSRYVYMGAMLLAPAFAVAVDRLGAAGPALLTAGRGVLVTAVLLNAGDLASHATDWARSSSCDRAVLSLLAGSPAVDAGDPMYQPLHRSLDVRLADLPRLVDEGAVHPRAPVTSEEHALVAQAWTIDVGACPGPP